MTTGDILILVIAILCLLVLISIKFDIRNITRIKGRKRPPGLSFEELNYHKSKYMQSYRRRLHRESSNRN